MNEQLYKELRPKALGIAYRMLGSVSDAEDIVQEALLRLHDALDTDERIESPRAYLATVVTRLCIDELRSARVRREQYVGEWLPEPIVVGENDPAEQLELSDEISIAFLVLLESLSPEQRAVFLLREVFDYPFSEISGIIGKSEAACRQLAVRARRYVEQRKLRFAASSSRHEKLAKRFFEMVEQGSDLKAVEALLAEDVELHSDGGGKAPAIARPLHGRRRVAKALLKWMRAMKRYERVFVRTAGVNGRPGAMAFDAERRLLGVMALGIEDNRIRRIDSMLNPDKLLHLGPTRNLAELLKAGHHGAIGGESSRAVAGSA